MTSTNPCTALLQPSSRGFAESRRGLTAFRSVYAVVKQPQSKVELTGVMRREMDFVQDADHGARLLFKRVDLILDPLLSIISNDEFHDIDPMEGTITWRNSKSASREVLIWSTSEGSMITGCSR